MKNLLLIIFLTVTVAANAQSFPYDTLLRMSREDLLAADFKYNAKSDQYTLKSNTEKHLFYLPAPKQNTGGHNLPDNRLFTVTIQMGDAGISYAQVKFNDERAFKSILSFSRVVDSLQVSVTTFTDGYVQFRYENLDFRLSYTTEESPMSSSASTRTIPLHGGTSMATVTERSVTSALNKVYTLRIDTGIEPTNANSSRKSR